MERNSIRFATRIDHEKRGIWNHPIPGARITAIVVRKLIPVRVDDATNISCPAAHILTPVCVVSVTTYGA